MDTSSSMLGFVERKEVRMNDHIISHVETDRVVDEVIYMDDATFAKIGISSIQDLVRKVAKEIRRFR